VGDPQEDVIRKVLGYARRVAVVGLSPRPYRDSNSVAATMQAWGYEVVPVNPNVDEVLGVRCYPSLEEVPGEIDLVDVFRRPEALLGIAESAASVGAKALWLQLGLSSPAVTDVANAAGMDLVDDRCLMVEVRHRRQAMTLPPG